MRGDGRLARDDLDGLASRRQQLGRLLTLLVSNGEARPGVVDVADGVVADELDRASSVQGRESAAMLARVLSANQSQIDRALARIVDGGYGTCEDCLGAIPAERMRCQPGSHAVR